MSKGLFCSCCNLFIPAWSKHYEGLRINYINSLGSQLVSLRNSLQGKETAWKKSPKNKEIPKEIIAIQKLIQETEKEILDLNSKIDSEGFISSR